MTDIDWTKPLGTTDGRAARVICEDRKPGANGGLTRIVLIDVPKGGELPFWAWDDIGNVSPMFGDVPHYVIENVSPQPVMREEWRIRHLKSGTFTDRFDNESDAEYRRVSMIYPDNFAVAKLTWQETAPVPTAATAPADPLDALRETVEGWRNEASERAHKCGYSSKGLQDLGREKAMDCILKEIDRLKADGAAGGEG